METYAFIAVLANKRDNETVKFAGLRWQRVKRVQKDAGAERECSKLKWHSQVLYRVYVV